MHKSIFDCKIISQSREGFVNIYEIVKIVRIMMRQSTVLDTVTI
jgi:hypothetical protein